MKMNRKQKDELITVLREAQRLLQLPTNDFAWSSWKDAAQATSEIDKYVEKIESDDFSSSLEMSVLFGPTGPIQEVSLSSGWGDPFLKLADRFDQAIKPIRT